MRRLGREKAVVAEAWAQELVVNRSEEGYKFSNDESAQQDPKEWKRLGARIRQFTGGEDVDIVFEPGHRPSEPRDLRGPQGRHRHRLRLDLGLPSRGYDNRYLWMNLARNISSRFAD